MDHAFPNRINRHPRMVKIQQLKNRINRTITTSVNLLLIKCAKHLS